MIGQRKAGAFVTSQIGRSGQDRRAGQDRRQSDTPSLGIETLAMTDGLTGLYSRGFLEADLKRELARCRRHGVMTSLLLVDLDDFRATNEQWGLEAGDAALRGTADVIRERVRAADAACRYGTDEFAIVLPDTYRSGARLVADRIVEQVRRAFVGRKVVGCPIALTVSAGVAWYGATAPTKGTLLDSAIRALAAAKALGGDRVAEAT
jgi:diguanylate cyclase (GGDEF)-like protein